MGYVPTGPGPRGATNLDVAKEHYVKGNLDLDAFESLAAHLLATGTADEVWRYDYGYTDAISKALRAMTIGFVPGDLQPLSFECSCSKCHERVATSDYTYPECEHCYYDIEGVCA